MTRSSDDVRARIVITGRVQGVFYRASCRDEASARGLRGWVRNLPDGNVEAVFEGVEDSVHEMIAWCRRGPPSAAVKGVAVSWEPVQEEPGFRIMK